MEDAFTRHHAQYLVAAVLAVGARAVGQLREHVRLRPPFVDLHALAVTHSREAVQALERAGRSVVRRALREDAHAVQPTPIDGGYRVRILLAPQRRPLQPYELTDLQVAWDHALRRELGPARLPLATAQEIATRQQELDTALADLREIQTRLIHGHPELQPELADAMNRAQVATDALRSAVQRATPTRADRRTYSDTLTFRVRTEGMQGLPLVDRDRAVRDLLARAAGLRNPAELRVTTRPTRNPDESIARVTFNLRTSPTRGPEHLNPVSLHDAILAGATSVPSVPMKVAAATVDVSIRAIGALRAEVQGHDRMATPDLPVSAPVREATPLTRER